MSVLARALNSGFVQIAPTRIARRVDLPYVLMLSALLLLPFQVIQISIAQPIHLWLVAALAIFAVRGDLRILTPAEIIGYLVFIYFALVMTFLQDFGRIKYQEQILKFALIYPGFYLVGRWLGWSFRDRPLPLGYIFLFGLLAFEYLVQTLALPVIHRPISFGQGALHGTFIERNWLALYFLLYSYAILLTQRGDRRFIPFFALNGMVMLLSGSKTAFIACGLIYLIHAKTPLILRLIPAAIGAIVYMTVFSADFTGDMIAVRLEEERGLALQAALELIGQNPLGYGLGFVESHFSRTWLVIRGLGEGVNSVFSVPLDLMIIAGFAGLVFWMVLFLGLGTGAVAALLPITALSLLNPLHQAESVYLFLGIIVSLYRGNRFAVRRVPSKQS